MEHFLPSFAIIDYNYINENITIFSKTGNITPCAMVKFTLNSSVEGKCIGSICSLATDVKTE